MDRVRRSVRGQHWNFVDRRASAWGQQPAHVPGQARARRGVNHAGGDQYHPADRPARYADGARSVAGDCHLRQRIAGW